MTLENSLDNIRVHRENVIMKRPLYVSIWKMLSRFKKMVFVAGPRQAGKTTFAKMIAGEFRNSLYFNWDIPEQKRQLIENPYFYEQVNRQDESLPLIIFDELHKYPQWKNYLKGIYDRDHDHYHFLISGSGRLDLYQKGGDSLAGRYLLFYLWPFTVAELGGKNIPFDGFLENPLRLDALSPEVAEYWEGLAHFSGFPDPFLNGDAQFYQIWSQTYTKQLLREDIRDLTALRNIEMVELLFSLLPSKVGAPLSLGSLSRDLQVSFDSIKKWLKIFEQFFLVFRISPWTPKIVRAITKEQKLYLYNYAGISSEAAKFENMAAVELWRAVSTWNAIGLGQFSLHYVRNRDKEEVDFLIANEHTPVLFIETKLSDAAPSKSLRKFQTRLRVPAVQLVNTPDVCKLLSNNGYKILVITAARWLSLLP